MGAGHQHDFQRPSTKRTKEDIATMSGNMVSVDEESLRSGLRELVRKTAQETLNALLDEEADEMVGAERYERTAAREAYRSGRYERKLATTSGAPSTSTATCSARCRGRSGRGSPRCSRPSMRRNRARRRRRRRPRWPLTRVDEAARGSQSRARGLRRDARLHRLPHAALNQDQDEQHHRAAEQGDPPPNPRRRHVPRREIRTDADDHQAEIHSRKRVGPQALPRHITARREGGQDVGR